MARCSASTIRCARWKPSAAPRAPARNARIVAVTGSVGKTGTKEMLRLCLALAGATHAAEKSYNNHWGVPLTLARMPHDAEFGVFEIGMNHAGEITPLAEMVRPHVAVITTVEPVHLGYFQSVEEIAEAKAEIFAGPGAGRHRRAAARQPAFRPAARARRRASAPRSSTFGYHDEADFRAAAGRSRPQGLLGHRRARLAALPLPRGRARRALREEFAGRAGRPAWRSAPTPCAACRRWRASPRPSAAARARCSMRPTASILLIDESYNANPASMRAALAAMATTPREAFPRRIAVLGDMLELGDASADLHRGLKEAVDAAGVDLVLACGPMMQLLFDDLAPRAAGRLGADLGRAGARSAGCRARGRRGDDQGLARLAHGAAGRGHAGALRTRGGLEGSGMLYVLVTFSDQIGPLNVFRYITFRTGGAIMTALLFVFLFGPAIIDLLRIKQGKGQPIREDGPRRISPSAARRPWAGS